MGPPRGESDDPPPVDAQLLVDPAVIDFGVFEFPEEPDDPQFLTSTFSVYNAGLEAMYLQGQGDVIGSEEFTVQGAPGPDTLAGHEVVEYTVVFQPLVDDVYEGEISLNLGDATVQVYGEAHAPRLEVEDRLEISTPYRCVQDHSLRVQNIGHERLTLDPNDFNKEGPQYGISWRSDERLELEPGDVKDLKITFAPTDDGSGDTHDDIEARIATNEPGNPIRTIAITATGIPVDNTVESFRFDTDLQSSLLIIPDTREAMTTTLEALASDAYSLVETIANKNENGVQVAVVGGWNAGAPCPTTARPFYDTRADELPDIAAAIADGLTSPVTSTDELLELAQGAVYQMGAGGCLDGFLRPGTSLHVLLLSNGSEGSSDEPSTYARSIANEVSALTGTGVEISVFVPGGQDCTDDGCGRLIAATTCEGTEGAVWDLATDNWSDSLATYGAKLVPPDGELPLLLSQAALVSSDDIQDDIVVTAEGQTDSLDAQYYSYDPGLRAVKLRMSAPIPAGSTVQVSYLPEDVCK